MLEDTLRINALLAFGEKINFINENF